MTLLGLKHLATNPILVISDSYLYLLGCLPALHGVHKYVQFHTLSNSGRNIGICVPSI